MKPLILIPIIFLLASCTYAPVVVHDADNSRCNLATNKLSVELQSAALPDFGDCGECVVVAGIYSTATVLVSGSIALVGNMVHWLEKQAKCDDTPAEPPNNPEPQK